MKRRFASGDLLIFNQGWKCRLMQRLSYKLYKNKLTISLGTKEDFKGVIVQVNLKYKIKLTKIFKDQDLNHQHVLHDNLLFCVFKFDLVRCICCFVYSK